ncbi:MAG: tRNA pseudouridine(38-40) synthase TruA [Albidovulum sp.]|nr:tRNA pseudouridine(38-40) synthase TruA [Albidovulum sp.]MDE0533215.1 tRNA pseudouridine(38-40) synthase TruA [Albidovulum sp.]
MPRFAFKIEYDGRPFAGWQRQKGQISVQQAFEEALGKIDMGVPRATAAGRTDSGVHAVGQVAHCDLQKEWEPFRLAEALNAHLRPRRVAVLQATRVANDFNARMSATGRRYVFRLVSRRAPLTYQKGLAWQIPYPLAADPMRIAAKHFLGRHDFTTFRSAHCQADSPVKTLDELEIDELLLSDGIEFRFIAKARSFMHRQIRSMVGSLERVGAGAWAPDDILEALKARDRQACGPVAPPDGLYFDRAFYDPDPFERPGAQI